MRSLATLTLCNAHVLNPCRCCCFLQGIYSFWGASPDTSSTNVTLAWAVEGGGELVVLQGERRCILVSSATSSTLTRMYAAME